jgi:trigger factor
MPSALTTTVTELPESRVRVQVHVPPGELEERIEHKARQLGSKLKLPGFRRGKVPAPLVIQRIGREAVLEEAVRDTLGSWYADAIDSTGIVPVGDPQVDLGELPPRGESLQFSIEIGVLPKAELGEYRGLEVGRGEPGVDEELLDRQIEELRERLGRLETVQRPAQREDFVVLDYSGSLVGDADPFPGGEGRDQLVQLGSGNLIEGFEDGLIGASAGERRTLELTFPSDYPNPELAGQAAVFEVTLKEVKLRELPEVDDDLAIDTGFDTIEELREDIRRRLREVEERRLEGEFREAALDVAVEQAKVQTPRALIEARAQEMWERMLHSLAHRGISREAYLGISKHSEEEILAGLIPDAERALRREAVLTAVVAAEEISPSEEELLEAVTPTAENEQIAPEQLLERLRDNGRLEELREDLAARRAMELIAAAAKPIPIEQARAREQLWTPAKERAELAPLEGTQEQEGGATQGTGRLWTPTDQRSAS